MHKKSTPREKAESNLFLIYPNSCTFLSLHCFTRSAYPTCSLWMYAEIKQHFYCYYAENSPSTLSALRFLPHFTFLPVLPEVDAVISQAFAGLSHPLDSPFFKSCLPLPCCTLSVGFTILAGRRTRWCQTLDKRGNRHKGQNDGRKERTDEWKTEGCWCKMIYFPLLFPKLTLLIFLTWNTATVEPSIVL